MQVIYAVPLHVRMQQEIAKARFCDRKIEMFVLTPEEDMELQASHGFQPVTEFNGVPVEVEGDDGSDDGWDWDDEDGDCDCCDCDCDDEDASEIEEPCDCEQCQAEWRETVNAFIKRFGQQARPA